MSVIKKIIIGIEVLITIMVSSSIFAIGPCNMNGYWHDPTGFAGKWNYSQVENMVIGSLIGTIPNCDGVMATGTVSENNIQLLVQPTVPTEICRFTVDMTATFGSDCASFSGQWVHKTDGKVDGAGQFTLDRYPIKIVEPKEDQFIITSKPAMPDLEAMAIIDGPVLKKRKAPDNVLPYTWRVVFQQALASGLNVDVRGDYVQTDSPIFKPDYEKLTDYTNRDPISVVGGVMGGFMTFSVNYFNNLFDEKQITLLGTNPGQTSIEQVLTSHALRQIACQESRYRQFDATREGGIGMPLIGQPNDDGTYCAAVGIMQLCKPKPTAEQIWNWRKNLNGGMALYQTKYSEALTLHDTELGRLNKERKEQGLPTCDSLPQLTPEQLERETLRRYNAGVEYRWEPRDAPHCEGEWIVSPSCIRENLPGCIADYVDQVLGCDINH